MVDLAQIQAVYYMFTLRINMKTQQLALKAQEQNLETRQAQLFIQVHGRYDREFWNDWLLAMSKNYRDFDEWNKDRSDPKISSARLAVATYMMGIGTLVKRGLLSSEIVSDLISGPVIMFWQKYSRFYMEYRVRAGFPTYAADLEYLYNEMMKLKPAGYSPRFSLDEVSGGLRGGSNLG